VNLVMWCHNLKRNHWHIPPGVAVMVHGGGDFCPATFFLVVDYLEVDTSTRLAIAACLAIL